jgi:hypothetical protein
MLALLIQSMLYFLCNQINIFLFLTPAKMFEQTNAQKRSSIESQQNRLNGKQVEVRTSESMTTRQMTRAEFIQRLDGSPMVFDEDIKARARMMGMLPALSTPEQVEAQKAKARIERQSGITSTTANALLNWYR